MNKYRIGGIITTIVAAVIIAILLVTMVDWNSITVAAQTRESSNKAATIGVNAGKDDGALAPFFFNDLLQDDNIDGNEFNFGPDRYAEAVAAYEKSDKGQNEDEFILNWLDADFKKSITVDPVLAAADIAYADAILGTRFLGTFYESAKEKWAETINLAKEEFCKDEAMYALHLTEFSAMLEMARPSLTTIDDGVTDQMYMNPYTDLKYGPDVIVMDTNDHTGHLLVYTFVIKDNEFKVAYRAECGYQPVNVAKLMKIDPTSKPNPPTPIPDPPTPIPDPPTPIPDPPTPKYNKDKTKGTQGDLVAPNDDPGPGPDTNNGKGAKESTKDEPSNSNHMTYEEYKEKIKDIEKAQSPQQQSQQQSSSSGGNVKVDDNGNKGTGNDGADEATPVKEVPAEIKNDEPAGAWGGPAD